jgi:hypothetical protein
MRIRQVVECGGRAKRRHRFRTHEAFPYLAAPSCAQKRRRRYALPTHSKMLAGYLDLFRLLFHLILQTAGARVLFDFEPGDFRLVIGEPL